MKKARLIDVAKAAGVAPNTASTILNRRPNSWASKETEKRVFDAAKELGYRPNKAAVGLRLGKIFSVGIIIPDLKNPYFCEMADLMDKTLAKQGYDTIIETSRLDEDYEVDCIRNLYDRQIGGVFLALMKPASFQRAFPQGAPSDLASILLSNTEPHELGMDNIRIDYKTGIREAISYLYRLGHRRFAFLSALAKDATAGHREEDFIEQLVNRGLQRDHIQVIHTGPTVELSQTAFSKFLEERPRENLPTAVIAMNDVSAIGVTRAAAEYGLEVPRDLSVVGIDNTHLGKYLPKALSSIDPHLDQIVEKSVEMLLQRINYQDKSKLPTQKHLIETSLIIRETTTAPLL